MRAGDGVGKRGSGLRDTAACAARAKDAAGGSNYCVGMHLGLAPGEISRGADELARASALQEAIVHQEAILSALPRSF